MIHNKNEGGGSKNIRREPAKNKNMKGLNPCHFSK